MCESEDIERVHRQTNDEIRCTLAALSDHASAMGDKELEDLIIQLREILAKRFLVNGIADWQREGDG